MICYKILMTIVY